MKKAIILFIFILTGTVAFSQPVSETELHTAALNFYKSVSRNKPDKKNAKIKKLIINKLDGVKTYAVAVFDNNDWVALSTDKSLKPILAHSLESSWTEPIIPPARLWFDQYDHYIYDAKVKNFHSPEDLVKNYQQVWNNLLSGNINNSKETIVMVPPLISTKWGQHNSNDNEDPYAYNYYMPSNTNCTHTFAGCPAVALGQLLHYWKHPNCNVFDWYNMPNELTPSVDTLYYNLHKKEIANFLINIANHFPTYFYGCGGSGTTILSIDIAVIDTFRFLNAEHIYKSSYNLSSWDSILIENLNNNLPILYLGCTAKQCHIYICDGWEIINNEDTLFHFNYGWAGNHNGFYSLNEVGLIYTANQSAIINLVHDFSICNEDSITIYQYYRETDSSLYYSPTGKIIYSSPTSILIDSNEVISYKAYNEIILENFETKVGADFTAEITTRNCISCNSFFDSTADKINNKILNSEAVNISNTKIYPNPSKGTYIVSLSNNDKNFVVFVFNYFGELILKMKSGNNKFQIDISDKPSGIYLIKIITKENIYQQKIVKL